MRKLPVAALPKGAVIKVAEHYAYVDLKIVKIENATPEPGQITLHFNDGGRIQYGAARRVEVVSLR